MSNNEKYEIISQIIVLLGKLIECDTPDATETAKPAVPVPSDATPVTTKPNAVAPDPKMEMLTIRECTDLVKGLTSNTIRKLIKRGELDYIRAGCGANGKILISKANLMALCYNHNNV